MDLKSLSIGTALSVMLNAIKTFSSFIFYYTATAYIAAISLVAKFTAFIVIALRVSMLTFLGSMLYIMGEEFGLFPDSSAVHSINQIAGVAFLIALLFWGLALHGRIYLSRNNVDPGKLHLPPTRIEGADPFKLQRQMKEYGMSTKNMPYIQVTKGPNGEMMINDGVTRATRVHVYNIINGKTTTVPVEVIETTANDLSHLPTVESSKL